MLEAELKVFIREAGVFLFMAFFPFITSLLSYCAGMALTGGQVTPAQWFYQLVGFTVMMVAFAMSSSSAWYFRRGMMTGRLEYILASPVSPLVAVLSSALTNVIFNIVYFILIASIGLVLVYGIGHLVNVIGVILFLAITLMPVIGFNLLVGIATIIFREPEPVTNVINSIVSAASGFTYPIILLPSFLQALGQAMPYSYIVNGAREILAGSFQLAQLSPQIFLLGYLALGLVFFRLGEVAYVRKSGVHW
ncbi:MAG: ABC transporter permease [Aigarchaeota archaeon]|nr:ABC transporter permease [Candidatus Calditenuaceae archaeon]